MTLLIHWSCWYKFEFVVYDGAIFKWIKWFSAAKFSILLNNLYLLAKNSNICNHVALSKFLFKPVFGLVSFLHPIKNISIFTCVCASLAKQSFWQSTLLQYWLIRECLNFFSVKYIRSNQKDAAVNNFFLSEFNNLFTKQCRIHSLYEFNQWRKIFRDQSTSTEDPLLFMEV